LERYQAGERVLVWRELIELGAKVAEEPCRSEAVRVCEEIVQRARFNLRMLHAQLLDLGYEFAEPHAALVDADPGAVAEIKRVEKELGALPLIARVWYQVLASVNFSQAERQLVYWQAVRAPTGPDLFGLGSHPVLIFQSLVRSREQLQHMTAEQEEQHVGASPSDAAGSGQFLPLGGWASNCEPKGFRLPCYAADAVIYNDGGGDVYFVDQLRSAFRWGGFPFWQWTLKNPNFYAPMHYRPNFKELLPVLTQGLLEL
jgi:hypothetical protein